MLSVYTRHNPRCPRTDIHYRRCRCPKWIRGIFENDDTMRLSARALVGGVSEQDLLWQSSQSRESCTHHFRRSFLWQRSSCAYSRLFDHPTTLSLDNPWLFFNVEQLADDARLETAMSLLIAHATAQRASGKTGQPSITVLDECCFLLDSPVLAPEVRKVIDLALVRLAGPEYVELSSQSIDNQTAIFSSVHDRVTETCSKFLESPLTVRLLDPCTAMVSMSSQISQTWG